MKVNNFSRLNLFSVVFADYCHRFYHPTFIWIPNANVLLMLCSIRCSLSAFVVCHTFVVYTLETLNANRLAFIYFQFWAPLPARPSRQRQRDIDRDTVLRINRRHRSCDYPWPPPPPLRQHSVTESNFSVASQHFDESLRKQHQIENIKPIFDRNPNTERESISSRNAIDGNQKPTVRQSSVTEHDTTKTSYVNSHNRKTQTDHHSSSTESYMCNKVGRQSVQGQQDLWTNMFQQQEQNDIRAFHLPDELMHGGELDRRIHRYFDGLQRSLSCSHDHEAAFRNGGRQRQSEMPTPLNPPFSSGNGDEGKRKSQSFNELPPIRPKGNARERQKPQNQQQQRQPVHKDRKNSENNNHEREEVECIIKNQFDNSDNNSRSDVDAVLSMSDDDGAMDKGEWIELHGNITRD
jgi:hypothetical protein